jgi:processive 1,2-diacylglycerol beta-glucosyltransferase
VKKILLLSVSFGEGHNAAARGIRDALARVAPDAELELHDLFAETYTRLNELFRQAYLKVINRWPRSWGHFYRWLDSKTDFDERFRRFSRLKKNLATLLERFQPDVVISTFPPYPYFVRQILGANTLCKSIVVVTDSITVNAIWYRCVADYFLLPNEQSAAVVRAGGVEAEKIKVFGFPISPKFADLAQCQSTRPSKLQRRVLYVITAGTRTAPELVNRLLDLDVRLTVAVGRNEKLRKSINSMLRTRNARAERDGRIEILGWTDDMPRLLCTSDVLIGKAGGATVQETIAAGCPMIINHVVSGQEEGNARLIAETNSGIIARTPAEVAAQVQGAFANDARQWHEWAANIRKMSRPRASLDIAEFVMSL